MPLNWDYNDWSLYGYEDPEDIKDLNEREIQENKINILESKKCALELNYMFNFLYDKYISIITEENKFEILSFIADKMYDILYDWSSTGSYDTEVRDIFWELLQDIYKIKNEDICKIQVESRPKLKDLLFQKEEDQKNIDDVEKIIEISSEEELEKQLDKIRRNRTNE